MANLEQHTGFSEAQVNLVCIKTINLLNKTLGVAETVNSWLVVEITRPEKHGEPTSNHYCQRPTGTTNMNDFITAIILSASGYGAFLAIGIGCLIGYNIWNRKNMERKFETNEAYSARLEKPEARLESGMMSWDGTSQAHSAFNSMGSLSYARGQRHRASSTPSLTESAINDIYQGRRRSTQTSSTLVEAAGRNKIGNAVRGQESTRVQRTGAERRGSVGSRDSWEL